MKKMLVLFLAVIMATGITANASQTDYFLGISEEGPISLNSNGDIQYNSYSDRGDNVPDFSYVGYNHNEKPIPHIDTVKTVQSGSEQKSEVANIFSKVKKEVLSENIGNDNYESIILRSHCTTSQVNSSSMFWEAIDGDSSDISSRWKYNQAAAKGEKKITFDLHTEISSKSFHTVVVYMYCPTWSTSPKDSLLGSFKLYSFINDNLSQGTQYEAYCNISQKQITNSVYRYTIDFENEISARYITMRFKTASSNSYNPEIMEIELYGDDSQIIQNAIDEVSKLTPDANGFRGAVLLEKGIYNISKPIEISASGVVLRGSGCGDDETILYANSAKQYDVISVGGCGERTEIPDTRQKVTDDYVPVGCCQVTVEDSSCYNVGDEIILHVQKNQTWIDLMGMGEGGVLDKEGKYIWTPDEYQYHYEKKITAIRGNVIEFDIPVVDALNTQYDCTEIYKYEWTCRITDSAIETLQIESAFDPSYLEHLIKPGWETYSDINHAKIGVVIDNAENCWVDGVVTRYMSGGCVNIGSNAKKITVQNCSYLDGVSPIRGGYRYSFQISGQQCLVRDCYSYKGRHDYSLGAKVCGPNVFSNCVAENSYAQSETHQRWACGVLYDNITVYGPNGLMAATNRGDAGTGHGWTGGQVVFWNCNTPMIIAMKPPTGQNFVIGAGGSYCTLGATDYLKEDIDWINSQAGTNYSYEKYFTVGDAYFYNIKAKAQPVSLFEKQLEERIGICVFESFLYKTEDGEQISVDKLCNGKMRVRALVRNTGKTVNNYNIIIALKTGNKLTAIFRENKKTDVQNQAELTADFELTDADISRIYVYVWDGDTVLTPICKPIVFN